MRLNRKSWLTALILVLSLQIIVVAMPSTTYADSPLTSTPFYEAYLDEDIVKQAADEGLNEDTALFLSQSTNPLDVRAAVINAFYSASNSWDERNLAERYSEIVYGKSAEELEASELRDDELFVLGYLQALDEYLNPSTAWLNRSVDSHPNSFTVAIVNALVNAQSDISCGWGVTQPVLDNKQLNMDMRAEAVTIIRDYMELYKDWECGSEPVDHPIQVVIDGEPLRYSHAPIIVNGRVLVPLRSIFEALEASVFWNGETQEITAHKGGQQIVLRIGQQEAYVNDKPVKLDQPALLSANHTLVPVRFISEALGAHVEWNGTAKAVSIVTDK